MANSVSEDEKSFDEFDSLMPPRRRFSVTPCKEPIPEKLSIAETEWLKIEELFKLKLANDGSKSSRRHSSPNVVINGNFESVLLPNQSDYIKKLLIERQKETGKGVTDEEEGWKMKDDGTFSYEDDDRLSIKSVSRVKHVYSEWKNRKQRKKGLHWKIIKQLSRTQKLWTKICNPEDKNLKLKVFLLFISILIIGGVSTVWHFYHKIVLQAVIDRGIRIIEEERVLYLANRQGIEKLGGIIGQSIPEHLMPYDCLHVEKEPSICLTWKYRAKLRIFKNHTSNNHDVQCFRLEWKSFGEEKLRDCFDIGHDYWYGVGESFPQQWPLNLWRKKSSSFVTGNAYKSAFGSVLERYFLTSSGVSIVVDNDVPLSVSINEEPGKICLEATFDKYPYKREFKTQLPFLRYNLCAGKNAKETHEFFVEKFLTERHENSEHKELKAYVQNPIWSINPILRNLNHSSLLSFANAIMQNGYKPGFLNIGSNWQEHHGDFSFNSKELPDVNNTLITLHNKGFKPILEVSPYISVNGKSFNDVLRGNFYIFDSEQKMPMMTKWRTAPVALLDFTNIEAESWMFGQLLRLMANYQIVGFSFVGGQSLSLPYGYNMKRLHINPDFALWRYGNIINHKEMAFSMLSTSVFEAGTLAGNNCTSHVFTLSPRSSDWSDVGGLRSIIPSVLTHALFGHSIINIGSVGGDKSVTKDKELYIRWLQIAIFMPILQFSVAPYDIDAQATASELLEIRKSLVVPHLKTYINSTQDTRLPLIRPMWWLSPDDPEAFSIDDQFLVTDTILVAPIVDKNRTKRNIYLPEGWWRDFSTNQKIRGKKWIYDYDAAVQKVPYFLRLKDSSDNR